MSADSQVHDEDSAELKALGYSSHFERSMSKWENFALGFTYLSPVVGVYTIFASTFAVGGPPMWWSYLLVGVGQMLVCLVFGEVVSQFPISGGLYPWARRLVGKRWAWMAGWVYWFALNCSLAAVAIGGAPYFAQMLGLEVSPVATTGISLALILLSTLINLRGTHVLARVAMAGFICELLGAIAVGGWLLLFARHRDLGVILDPSGFVPANGNYLPAFLASSLSAMFCYYGFEACGDVAEETPNASRTIPKAMRMTIYVGGGAAMFVCLALILAVPDLNAVISGQDKDPVATTLISAMGVTGFRIVVLIVLISFISCALSLQAAASRLIFAYARDQMMPGSAAFSRLSPNTRVPNRALITVGVVPAAITLLGLWLTNAVNIVISFAAIGIYISFQMIVAGALWARFKGWRPGGPFTLRGWGLIVNVLALIYGLAAIANMAWPRTPAAPWYGNYAMVLVGGAMILLGAIYMLVAKPYERGNAPAGDAALIGRRKASHAE